MICSWIQPQTPPIVKHTETFGMFFYTECGWNYTTKTSLMNQAEQATHHKKTSIQLGLNWSRQGGMSWQVNISHNMYKDQKRKNLLLVTLTSLLYPLLELVSNQNVLKLRKRLLTSTILNWYIKNLMWNDRLTIIGWIGF